MSSARGAEAGDRWLRWPEGVSSTRELGAADRWLKWLEGVSSIRKEGAGDIYLRWLEVCLVPGGQKQVADGSGG